MSDPKPIEFRGDSLSALRRFPEAARRRAGHQLDMVQLDMVQHGLEPNDWKPMNSVGAGVREIRIRDEKGIFRAMYVTKFGDTIYVLHCSKRRPRRRAPPISTQRRGATRNCRRSKGNEHKVCQRLGRD